MAKIITTGPAHMFVGQTVTKTGTTAVDGLEYLGTFEKSPVIDIQTLTQPVMNDIGGESPISFSMQGQIATIQGVMNRFDEDELAKIESGFFGSTRRGEIGRLKMGGLAQAMFLDFDVVFYFPFHSTFRTTNQPKTLDAPEGLHFVSVVPAKIKLAELSTRARTVEIALRAIPRMSILPDLTNKDSNLDTVAPASVREFMLYRHIDTVSNTLKDKVN